MNTTRRQFGVGLGMAAVGLMVPCFALKKIKGSNLNIGTILKTSHHLVLEHMRNGRPFASPLLNQAVLEGRIRIDELNVAAEVAGSQFRITQYQAPYAWTATDEQLNLALRDKVAFVRAFAENGINSHDWHLEGLLESNDLIVSKRYRYNLGEVYHHNGRSWVVLYTAYAVLPKGILG